MNLARLWLTTGRAAEAERVFREGLETARRNLGPENDFTLGFVSSLAEAREQQGDLEEAERLCRDVLEIDRRASGPDSSNRMGSLMALARVWSRQGRHEDAERLSREALDRSRRLFGQEHRGTLGPMNALASVLSRQRRYEEAERLSRFALEISRRVFGETGEPTGDQMYNMACLDALRGQRGQALDWLRRAIEAGYGKADWLAKDPDLEPLHGDPEFERLLTEATKNAGRPLEAGP